MTKGSGQQRSSWRKSTRSAASSAANAKSYGAGDFGSRGRSRRQLLFQVSALLTLAVGLCVILAIYLWRKPYAHVPLIFAGVSESKLRTTNDPLYAPPNPFAAEDARLLSDWFRDRADQNLVFVGNPTEQSGTMAGTTDDMPTLLHTLVGQIGNVPPGGPDGDVIAMFVTAHGIVDDQNDQPYLIVGDSQPDDVSSWISVESLLSGIKLALESNEAKIPSAKVVVFLDASRGGEIWDWGKFDSSFPERCRAVASRVAPDRIAVISSCGDGQRSWWDPRRGQSLFARAIVQSLTGSGDDNGDDVITVAEIAKFVREQVATDARAIWAASQTPELLTSAAADWRVIRQPAKVSPPTPIDVDLDRLRKVYSRIDELWKRHNGVAKMPHPPLVTSPLDWSVLEKQLARLDQLALAGEGYHGELEMLASACETMLTKMESGSPLVPSGSVLPEQKLTQYFHGQSKISEAANEFAAAWQKDPSPAKVSIPFGLSEPEVTRMLWPWLIGKEFDASSLEAAGNLVEPLAQRLGTPVQLLETHLIRLLSASDVTSVRGAPAKAIVLAHEASRDALLSSDLRASFWIRQRLTKLDGQRMSLSDAALARGVGDGPSVRLTRLTENDYADLRREGERISQAYRLRDRMFHEVPRLAETLLADVVAFVDDEKSKKSSSVIQEATDAVRCLAANLRLADAGDEPRESPALQNAARQAEIALTRLRQRVDERVSAVAVRVAGDESGLRKSLALLQGSGVNDADGRQQLHTRLLNLLVRDASDLQSKGQSQAVHDTEATRDLVAIDGVHPWSYWLSATESLTCGPPPATSDAPSTEPFGSFVFQGAILRRDLSDLIADDASQVHQIPAKLSRDGDQLAKVRQDVDDLDTRYRSRTFLLNHAVAKIEKATQDRFALDLQLFAMDHARRTIDEYWCEARAGEPAFFSSAADRLLRFQSFVPLGSELDGRDLAQYWAQATSVAKDKNALVARPAGDFTQGALLENLRTRPVPFVIDRPGVLPSGQLSIWTQKQSPLLPMGDANTEVLETSLSVPPEITSADEKFSVETFFRGLRRQGGLDIKHLKNGRTSLFRLDKYGSPTAVVESDVQAAEKVVIVLDCSNSMNDRGRLDNARTSLRDYLRKLKKGQSSVGLILFGHRYGWQLDSNDDLIRDRQAVGTKYKVIAFRNQQQLKLPSLGLQEVANHHPDFDVEVTVDLDQLTDKHLAELEKSIGGTNAVGVTPTYQAIDRAYDLLGANPGHIVVLTDGIPFLTDGQASKFRAIAKQKYLQRAKDVRLSIVNFDNQKQQVDLLNDFPGTLVNANNARELSEQLEDTIEKTTVVWKNDGREVSREVDLDSIVAIDRWPPSESGVADGQPVRPAQAFSIEAVRRSNGARATAKVHVQGGEAMRLRIRGSRLQHVPFPQEDHIVEDLRVDGSDKDKFSVFALSPDRNNNRELTLRVVVENRDKGAFTPRPSDVWIDLIGSDAADRRKIEHSISLADFESGHSVPVILARVKDWPDWAVQLQIDASLRFDDAAAIRVPLPMVAGQNLTVNTIDGVSFRVEQVKANGQQVKITETHAVGAFVAGSSDDRLRILPQPLPQEAVISFYRDDGIVVHEFRYNEPQDAPEAFLTKKSQIAEGASIRARTRQPITVRIDGR